MGNRFRLQKVQRLPPHRDRNISPVSSHICQKGKMDSSHEKCKQLGLTWPPRRLFSSFDNRLLTQWRLWGQTSCAPEAIYLNLSPKIRLHGIVCNSAMHCNDYRVPEETWSCAVCLWWHTHLNKTGLSPSSPVSVCLIIPHMPNVHSRTHPVKSVNDNRCKLKGEGWIFTTRVMIFFITELF